MKISLKALMIYVVSLFVFPFGFIVLPSYFIKLGLEKDNRLALISFGIFFVLSLVVSTPLIAIPVGLYIILVFYSILNLLSSGFSDTQAITISFCWNLCFRFVDEFAFETKCRYVDCRCD